MSKKPTNDPEFAIEMSSEAYGSEIFQYDTEQARLVGMARLLNTAVGLKDGIARTYHFGRIDREGEFHEVEIAAEFDGETVTFCEYGLPTPATVTG